MPLFLSRADIDRFGEKLEDRRGTLFCGGWSEDELRRAGCVAVFKDPADLLERF